MSAVPKRNLTEAQYLAMERTAETKHEFFDGEIFAMAGANRQHNEIAENLAAQIHMRLDEGPCRTYGSDMRVKVKPTGLYTYPDRVIVCDEPEFEKIEGMDTLLNPLVVFEIMSDTTEEWDRTLKFQHYQRVTTVREYVVISQKRVQVDHYIRQPTGHWDHITTFDVNDELALANVALRIPIAKLYRRVEPLLPPPGQARSDLP
jgi:Uma2 family endonuclease